MKIRPVGAELFQAFRQKDRHDDANSRFCQFCERAQKWDNFLFKEHLDKISWKYGSRFNRLNDGRTDGRGFHLGSSFAS